MGRGCSTVRSMSSVHIDRVMPPFCPLIATVNGHAPRIHPDAFVATGAMLLGQVGLGPRSGVWYGCVLRADEERIEVGADSNIQDGSILHADAGEPTVIGERVTVGHGAVIHGAVVESDVLVGMRAVVLNGAHVGSGSMIAAGAVLRPGTQVPPGVLVAGVPAKVRRRLTRAEREVIDQSWRNYVAYRVRHRDVGRPA
jgi:carbonic anhydrase/acetyltransferase-like protein (isoleucine patch superfamily)